MQRATYTIQKFQPLYPGIQLHFKIDRLLLYYTLPLQNCQVYEECYHVSLQVCSYCKIPVLASEMQYSMQHYSSKGCTKAIELVKVVVVPTQQNNSNLVFRSSKTCTCLCFSREHQKMKLHENAPLAGQYLFIN